MLLELRVALLENRSIETECHGSDCLLFPPQQFSTVFISSELPDYYLADYTVAHF